MELRGIASAPLVFPSDAGTPIEMNNFAKRAFQPILTAAALRRIPFHDLRHTLGSLLIQTGADIYGHLIPGSNISFVDHLDGLASPQQSATQPQHGSPSDFREFSASAAE